MDFARRPGEDAGADPCAHRRPRRRVRRYPRGLQFRERSGIARKPTTHKEERRIASEDAPLWIELARSLGITLD